MENIAKINNRQIKFEEFDTSKNWIVDFPDKNWSLIIIADEKNAKYFDEIIRKALDRNVVCISGVGKQQELIHDLADEVLVIRDVENLYLPEHFIMTTGHENFEDGLWFGIYTAESKETEIEQVIVLDVSRKARARTTELVKRFELGYVPEN